MKKTFAATTFAVAVSAAAALAQDAARAPRVAVIDMARVSAESQLGKSYAAQLEKLQNDINAEATKKLVGAGLGFSVVSEVAAKADARAGALSLIALRPALHRKIGIIRRRDRAPRPALQAFMTALESAARRVRSGTNP